MCRDVKIFKINILHLYLLSRHDYESAGTDFFSFFQVLHFRFDIWTFYCYRKTHHYLVIVYLFGSLPILLINKRLFLMAKLEILDFEALETFTVKLSLHSNILLLYVKQQSKHTKWIQGAVWSMVGKKHFVYDSSQGNIVYIYISLTCSL